MKRFSILLFALVAQYALAQTEVAKQTICLNMIVKNEEKVITRCLDSVKKIIDYWVIVDTGSTDNTIEVIKNHMKEIPEEIHERPWKNWGETRSEAYHLAKGKGDYILFMDADDILQFDDGFTLPHLSLSQYNMWRGTKNFSYLKPQIVKGDLPWQWIGVTHEYLRCDAPITSAILEGIHYTSIDDGATRSTGVEKYWKNVRLLEEALKKEPNNGRYVFYLAESYRDAGDKAKALEWYQKRIHMGGWGEEMFCAKLQLAHMIKALGLSPNIAIEAYREAFIDRPHRIEPLYYMVELYNRQEAHQTAYQLIKMRDSIERPKEKDYLFNEDWIEEYGLLFQLSICSYYLGFYEESLKACDQLLTIENLPESWRTLTETNRTFPLAKLQEIKAEKELISKQ